MGALLRNGYFIWFIGALHSMAFLFGTYKDL